MWNPRGKGKESCSAGQRLLADRDGVPCASA